MTIRTWIAACGLTLCLLTSHAMAGPLEDANAALHRGDFATALNLYRPLARDGNATAQFYLGYMYYNGKGVPEDYAAAVKWFRLAADQGDASSQRDLGIMYYNGDGVPQDYVQAHMWFNLAAAASDWGAMGGRDLTAEKMTPAQIAEAQRLAREWMAAHPKP